MKHLGEYIDIHCGGVDNMFPHHTNEIAQSESYLGHRWCSYWFHSNHLNDRAGKMSKSKGAVLTVSVLQEKGYDPLVYRFFCLQSHYRKPLEFSFEALDQAATAFNKLVKRVSELKNEGKVDEVVKKDLEGKFLDAVSNDLNTSMAITVLYDALKADTTDATKLALVESFDKVLSLDLVEHAKKLKEGGMDVDPELLKYIEEQIAKRTEAKKNKDFATADAIRDELMQKGIEIKDTREGVKWQIV
jgi:cysteinyl-tRNA synthetase